MSARRLLVPVALLFALLAGPVQAAPSDPLPSSSFQGGDGDQLDDGGRIDWQGLAAAGRVTQGPDDNASDTGFDGGNKELEPGQWVFTTTAGGVTPDKNNILGAWYSVDRTEAGSFLYFAFHRQATEGATFLGFELNQRTASFVNPVGETVPCRVNGDVILSYEVDPADPAGVRIVLYRWTATATDAASGCSTAGDFTADPALAGTFAQAAMNFAGDIPNHLAGGPATLAAGSFGEGAVNFTQIVGPESCTRYRQIQLHSRTSAAISAALKDFVGPVASPIGGCAIEVVKTGPATAQHGDTVTFRYAVTNPGAQPLAGVTLSDDKCAPIAGPAGDADGDALLDLFEVWEYTCTTTIGAHADGEENPVVNTATVSGSFLGQVVSAQDAHATEILHPAALAAPAADLTIAKDVVDGSRLVGEPLTYRVTVTNRGPGSASDVVVADPLSDTVRFVSATPSQGTCAGAPALRCTLGSLAAGATAAVTIRVVPLRAGQLLNTATVRAAEPDPHVPNVATVETPIEGYRGVLRKRAEQRSARPGDVVTYVITYRNLGPGTARDLTVCDELPRVVTLVRAYGGRLAGGRVCWRHARVRPGRTVRMRLRVRLDRDARPGVLRNVVVASGATTTRARSSHRLRIRYRPPRARGGGVTG